MQPEQITNRRGEGVLEVLWEDGERQQATHRQLRAACKCSHCQSARLRGELAAPAANMRLDAIRPIGHYAVQLVFSDGHDRGIYPWALLRSAS
ncbi:DUF971 domain-containing protein [Massilia sp. TWP1-3-3]|uniref:DUF971 domain-containing protein n=1 Tax=Massilia sp. TWP1-3-3 TaxID=2804573 RepID=UPI003CE6D267